MLPFCKQSSKAANFDFGEFYMLLCSENNNTFIFLPITLIQKRFPSLQVCESFDPDPPGLFQETEQSWASNSIPSVQIPQFTSGTSLTLCTWTPDASATRSSKFRPSSSFLFVLCSRLQEREMGWNFCVLLLFWWLYSELQGAKMVAQISGWRRTEETRGRSGKNWLEKH